MYLLLLLAAVAILGVVVVVAMGEGGEMALSRRDLPPLSVRLASAADVARLRLPISLLGYSEQATADALRVLARLLEERDAEIARLRAEARGPGGPGEPGGPGGEAADVEPAPRS